MNCCITHLMCIVIMLSQFVLGALSEWGYVIDNTFDLDEACRYAKTEWDKCFGQNKECNVIKTFSGVRLTLGGSKGNPAAFEEAGKCVGEPGTIDWKPEDENYKKFVGVCRPLALEFDRTCSLSPCPYWSFKYLIQGNSVIGMCYSSAARTSVTAAIYFAMVAIISLLGHSYISSI